MAESLKSTYPVLGRILGETPAALYGAQVALVRAGLLDSIPGRGPGSGVRAGARSVAQMLVGLAAHASVSENVPRAKALANATHGRNCALTGEHRFVDALTRILQDEALAARVNEIRLLTSIGYAIIFFDGSEKTMPLGAAAKIVKVTRSSDQSVFVSKRSKPDALHFTASIFSETVRALAKAIAEFSQEAKS